ncbi:elongation factor P--(R)-beta-lysine ligase [Spirochaetia bacterium]|nr:elongation factor P--(R)-beta-lysine ligase [Spirochaetia bacterium]
MDIELLQERARIIKSIRNFFDSFGYLECDTPLLSPNLIPESCLEVFETSRLVPTLHGQPWKESLWLVPSPEIWMKKLLADHHISLYQICHCFRNVESIGKIHNPEFSMLEYYTIDAMYKDSLILTEELLRIFPAVPEFRKPLLRLTMAEAFFNYAGIDLFTAFETGSLEEHARNLDLNPPAHCSPAELYDLIFVHAVEPRLPIDQPVALMDYPAFVPCLAQKSPDGRTTERWELYIRGVELANCYSEERDPDAVRLFFETEAAKKSRSALVQHAVDQNYWQIFRNFPRCSGVALGLDRLIMIVTGRHSIDSILPF